MEPSKKPDMSRNNRNIYQLKENALPSAAMTNKPDRNCKVLLLPNLSAGLPMNIVPIMVPIRAMATVKPSENLLN